MGVFAPVTVTPVTVIRRGGAKRLATALFGADRAEFQEALKKDEAERRAKRGR